jgi:DNA polymerase Ligase (LigD)
MSGVAQTCSGRFVVLRHEGSPQFKPGVHWDLMFERGSALKTWSVQRIPSGQLQNGEPEIDAEQLADHRLAYLDYEGPVSGNRGVVTRFDTGRFELIEESQSRWIVALRGEKLRGRLTLSRATDGSRWRCTFAAN